MNLRQQNLEQLVQTAKAVRSKVCGGYCDQLNGYHQGECIALGRIVRGKERRVTVIRKFIAVVNKMLTTATHPWR